jgi:hypothetical protein
MKRQILKRSLIVFCMVAWLNLAVGCKAIENEMPKATATVKSTDVSIEKTDQYLPEVEVISIPLPAPLDKPNAEISGMAWYGDKLVLLPQYPDRFNVDDYDSLFFIEKEDLLNYIENPEENVISLSQIPFDDGSIQDQLPGFEGYEAIAFTGDRFYITIETKPDDHMMGYLAAGSIEGDLVFLSLNLEKINELPPQDDFTNASDEAIVIYQEKVYTIFEDNGQTQNPDAIVHVFDLDLNALGTIPMAPIAYRVTDATEADENGVFWVMNYFYPGDTHLVQDADPLTELYGEGETHALYEPVERIVKMALTDEGVTLVDEAPILIKLLPDDEARNWEGIVHLDGEGFLIATDKFPETILGFIKF